MTIQITATKNTLANSYRTSFPNGALFASTGPGTSGAATNEISGGSPAYARKSMGFGAASGGTTTSAATPFDVGAGTTVTYFGVTASATAGTADVADFSTVTSQNFASQGTYTITASFAIS
jgi:hypothetical protein